MAQDFNFNFRLPTTPKHSDTETWNELMTLYTAIQNVADALERRNKVYAVAYEDIPERFFVSFMTDSGVAKVRLAKHATYEAHGWATVAAKAGQTLEVCMYGLYFNLSSNSKPAGTKWYLSATPGNGTDVNPGAGSQRLGFSINTSQIWINPLQLP